MNECRAKTIYLHLGTYKTATTFIQHVLWNHFNKFSSPVYYPKVGTYGTAHHYLATNEFPGWTNGVTLDEYETVWKALLKDISDKKAPSVILSSELLCSLSLERIRHIREILKGYRLRAILYLRRQDHFISSLAAQLIKGCHGKPEYYTDLNRALEFISTSERFDYMNMCNHWAQVIGKSNLIVRPFEQSQFHNNEILADFFHHLLGMAVPATVKPPTKQINPRLCRDALEFKLLVNQMPLARDTMNATLPALLAYSESVGTQRYYHRHDLLSPSQRIEILNRYSDVNAFIARTYLGREDGILFSEPMPDSSAAWEPYPGLSTKKLKAFVHSLRETVPDVVESLAGSMAMTNRTAPLALCVTRLYTFSPISEETFFESIKDINPPSIDKIVAAMSCGLISRNGESAFAAFKSRIARYWPDYMKTWKEARSSCSFGHLLKSIRLFLNRMQSNDIVDEEYPLVRSVGNLKYRFCDVRLLKSLSVICAGEVLAPNFIYFLTQGALADPLNYINFTALSQLLLERNLLRQAADFALDANRLHPYDLCVSKTIVSTQKALFLEGMKPDIDHVCDDKSDLFCEMPFKVLNIFQYRADQPLSFFLCSCRGWTPVVFGSNFSWDGVEAQEFRHSILDGSFRYCDELACPFLKRNALPKRTTVNVSCQSQSYDINTVRLDKGPRDIVLTYDRSCNLSCPSCRDKVFVSDIATTEYYNETIDSILPPLLSNAKSLDLSQSGEALASPHFRRLLKSIGPSKYPDLQIALLTNLKLISQKTWKELGETADSIKTLRLSIDGAKPQTLEKLRRGLRWDRMLDALNFIRDLRRSSKLCFVPVNFVIQKDNFRELPEMLELCSNYCLDHLRAVRIRSHGSYTNDQFRDIDVGEPAHPLHTEYIDVIQQTLALHKEMEKNALNIMASGRSIPSFTHPLI